MSAKRKAASKKSSSGGIAFLLWPVKFVLGLVLPFFLLLRGSVTLYVFTEWNPYLCILIGAIGAMVALYFYLSWILGHIVSSKKNVERVRKINLRLVLITVGGFCLYAIMYLAAGNAKTSTIQEEYGNTHPLLRLGISSFIIFDRDLVVTDLTRKVIDYESMGLAKKKKSLHFIQSDEYVHAVDLRTNNRPEWRNTLLNWYFQLMGFRTLRHVGTADHLHISLMIHDNPQAL